MELGIEWRDVLVPDTSPLEIVVRGTLMYLVLYLMLRVVRRDAGALSVNDLLVLVLIADAAQNAMAGDYSSIADGILLVAVIVGWAFAVNWIGYHVRFVQRFVHPPAVAIVEKGEVREEQLRRYLVTHEELLTQIRLQGVSDVTQVQVAYVEGNGQISVLTGDDESRGTPSTARPDSA